MTVVWSATVQTAVPLPNNPTLQAPRWFRLIFFGDAIKAALRPGRCQDITPRERMPTTDIAMI